MENEREKKEPKKVKEDPLSSSSPSSLQAEPPPPQLAFLTWSTSRAMASSWSGSVGVLWSGQAVYQKCSVSWTSSRRWWTKERTGLHGRRLSYEMEDLMDTWPHLSEEMEDLMNTWPQVKLGNGGSIEKLANGSFSRTSDDKRVNKLMNARFHRRLLSDRWMNESTKGIVILGRRLNRRNELRESISLTLVRWRNELMSRFHWRLWLWMKAWGDF